MPRFGGGSTPRLRVQFLSPANHEFLEAIEFYESNQPGLAMGLVEDVEGALALITEFPSLGSPAPKGARRVHLRRFPYSLVYQRTEDITACCRALGGVGCS